MITYHQDEDAIEALCRKFKYVESRKYIRQLLRPIVRKIKNYNWYAYLVLYKWPGAHVQLCVEVEGKGIYGNPITQWVILHTPISSNCTAEDLATFMDGITNKVDTILQEVK